MNSKSTRMKEGLIKDTYELVLKELQTIISIIYILMVGIGMLFTFHKYARFGINIFDYADVFEFLIAPFSDYRILLFATSTFIMITLLVIFDNFWRKKHPKSYSFMAFGWDKKKWYEPFRYVLYPSLFISYLYISAIIYSKHTTEQIKASPAIALKYADDEVINGIIIGKTNDKLFLWQSGKVIAVPIHALVKEFEIE